MQKKSSRRRRWLGVVLLVLVAAAAVAWFRSPTPVPPPGLPGDGMTMRAYTYDTYGAPEVLALTTVERRRPKETQVLVEVVAAAANPLDWHYLRGIPYIMRLESGLRAPANPRVGVDFAGRVVAVGSAVTRFKPGDEVFGAATGAFAEYVLASQERIAAKPPGVGFAEAAAVPIAALTALQGLRDKGQLRPGQKVLVNGASGGVGTYAVQIARQLGAEVTGVCSTRNVELVRSLGAQRVIDYTREDYTQGSERYDLILDLVGNHGLTANRRVLTDTGRHVLVGGGGPDRDKWLGPFSQTLASLVVDPFVSQELTTLLAEIRSDDLAQVAGWLAEGKVRSVIDRSYAFEQLPEAIGYLESGRARGKVVIQVASGQ